MNLAKLEAEKSKLVKRILDNKVADNCEKLARCGTVTLIKKRDEYTNHEGWYYEDNDISITYECGIDHYGRGKRFKILEKETNTLVLETTEIEQKISIKLEDNCFLTQYVPGDWEEKIKEKIREIPKTEIDSYKKYFPSINTE